MKIYHTTFKAKFWTLLISLIVFGLGAKGLLDNSAPIHIKAMSLGLAIVFPVMFYSVMTSQCEVDDEKIIFRAIFGLQTLYWKDVSEISTYFFIFPSQDTVLVLKDGLNNKNTNIPVMYYPNELLKEILNQVPLTTKTNLNSALKKRILQSNGEAILKRFNINVESLLCRKPILKNLMNYLIVYFIGFILVAVYLFNFSGFKISLHKGLFASFLLSMIFCLFYFFSQQMRNE